MLCLIIIFIIHKPPNFLSTWPVININAPSSFLPKHEKLLVNKTRRFAIFAASIHSTLRSYIFYTPITAASWQRIGYDVIVIFVGDFKNIDNIFITQQLNLSRALLDRLGVHVINFQCDKSYATKISQLVRIFTGYLSDTIIKDSEYILTTDSDIIPMFEKDYQLTNNTSGFIYNAFCCGSFKRRNKTYAMYPMSHICITKKIWRDLFIESTQRKELFKSDLQEFDKILLTEKAPFSFDLISFYTRQEFGKLYDSNMIKGDSGWYMDQVYSSMLLNDYLEQHPDIKIDKRYKGSPRLDPHLPSSVWQEERLKTYGDAHIIHDEIFDLHRFSIFKHLINFLFSPTLAKEFDFYYKQFTLTLHDKPAEN